VIKLVENRKIDIDGYLKRSLLPEYDDEDRLEAVLLRNEEPKSQQVSLAALSDAKLSLLTLPGTLKQTSLLLKLVNISDEPLLYTLFKDKLFNPANPLGLARSLDG
jgi:hypothetical protein